MRWLKQIVPMLLMIAALAVVLATALSGHEDDYGRVPFPAGGTVELPQGTVKVYYQQTGENSQPIQFDTPIRFEVRPADGGPPLEQRATTGDGEGAVQVERTQELGAFGSVAEVEVPSANTYVVHAAPGPAVGAAALGFGTDPLSAVADRWRLLAALLGAAILIALIPLPKPHRGHWEQGADSGWSSDPRAPYRG